jgi:peptide/nickel transport system substrate-binding protein
MKLKHFWIKLRLSLKKIYLEIKHTHIKDLRNVFLKYIKKLPNIIHLRNLVLFSGILSVVIMVMFVQRFTALAGYFEKATPVQGGVYREGVLGNIEKINPLFNLNSAEESANRLVYSGLTRVTPNNEVIPDLADSWKISNDKKTYVFTIKENAKWHDGQKVTPDDIVYTIQLIQNPDTKTSESVVWKDVNVEKVNDKTVKITLPNPFADFLKVASQPILPKHLLDGIDPKNIKVAQFNQAPIGTGPYKFVRFDQAGNEQEVVFAANDDFVLQKPYLREVHLRIYSSFDDLYKGFIRKQVDGIVEIPFDRIDKIEKQSELSMYKFYLPRLQAIFFNYKNPILSDKNIRKALEMAVSRKEIISKAVFGQANPVYASILAGQTGYDPTLRVDKFDKAKVNAALDVAGYAKKGDGFRQKDGKELAFNLVYVKDDESERAGEEIKKEMADVGVKINLAGADTDQLQANYVRPRNYDILLIGEDIGIDPDLYSFWHSSQVNDPGLNLSGFQDRKVDKLLEQIRKVNDPKYKSDRLKEIQATLAEEVPAVYLYNPIYAMAISKNIKGIPIGRINTAVDHLNSIYSWYSREKISY